MFSVNFKHFSPRPVSQNLLQQISKSNKRKYQEVTFCLSQEARLKFLKNTKPETLAEMVYFILIRRAARVYAQKEIKKIRCQLMGGYKFVANIDKHIKALEKEMHI